MKTTIGAYAPDTRDVPVTFEEGEIIHSRRVNACHDGAGNYDGPATEKRVADVARGVAAKITVGAIVNTPEPELPAVAPEQPAITAE